MQAKIWLQSYLQRKGFWPQIKVNNAKNTKPIKLKTLMQARKFSCSHCNFKLFEIVLK